METVCTFSSDDEAEVASVRDLLEENGIPTLVKNLYTQNLFSYTKMLTGHDAISGSIQVFVRQDDIDRGLELLTEATEGGGEQEGNSGPEATGASKPEEPT